VSFFKFAKHCAWLDLLALKGPMGGGEQIDPGFSFYPLTQKVP